MRMHAKLLIRSGNPTFQEPSVYGGAEAFTRTGDRIPALKLQQMIQGKYHKMLFCHKSG